MQGIPASFEKIEKVGCPWLVVSAELFLPLNLVVDIHKINMTLPIVDISTDFQE